MSRRVPKKNIEPVLVDIKKPDFSYRNSVKLYNLNLTRIPVRVSHGRSPWAFFKFGALGLAVILALGIFVVSSSLGNVRTVLEDKGESAAENFLRSIKAIKELDTKEAGNALRQSQKDITEIEQIIKEGPNAFAFGAISNIVPVFKDVGEFLGLFAELNLNLIQLADSLDELKVNGFGYFQRDGASLISTVRNIKDLTIKISSQIKILRNKSVALSDFSYFKKLDLLVEEYYLDYGSELYTLEGFLDGLLALLDSGEDKNILLLFQNPSEIRPAGGFIGSYAVITLRDGQMVELDVKDIYDPDGQLDIEIIPPSPLWHITTDWEARDSNWFFDFPASAKAVSFFLESSKIYKEQGVTFDGVIALNINVLESVLETVGAIELPGFGLVINEDNFLREIQKEIETSRDRGIDYPKRILQVMTPTIMERLENLTENQRRDLTEKIITHFDYKDISVFSEDDRISHFLSNFNLDGAVYSLPSSFWGGYLAVVNANIAGGKSDVFVKQSIDAWLDISSEGGVISDVLVKRVHKGDQEEEFWYRATNKNYIKVFTGPGSELIFVDGNDARKRVLRDYEFLGDYKNYEDWALIEETEIFFRNYNVWKTEEFGKNVFGTWFNVEAGEERSLNLRYETPVANSFSLSSGKIFRFVFDRQSGVDTSLKVTVNAPLGYVWVESGLPAFIYETDNPEKRVVFDLTLEKRGKGEFIEVDTELY